MTTEEALFVKAAKAVERRYYRYVDSLLRLKPALLTESGFAKVTLLYLAASDPRMTRLLLDRGADPDFALDVGLRPLRGVAAWGDSDVARLLIDRGARVREDDIMTAVWHKNAPVLRVLLGTNYGANFITKDSAYTPLEIAAANGDTACCALLLEYGAAPDLIAPYADLAPLALAAASKSVRCVELLLDAGAEPNDGPPEHWALWSAHSTAVARVLLEHGADPNLTDSTGRTPLHYAAMRCRVSLIKLLKSFGASTNIKDAKGRTPLDYARMAQCAEGIAILR